MSGQAEVRADQWILMGLSAVMTAAFLAYIGYSMWRDVQAKREMQAFRNRVMEQVDVARWESEADP